ncbi:MAG: hypothetical protein PHD74_06195, partial [Candidatus Krumholzibacteria bacterium]|nr:hypothetical protein [Candidatus Krumholzibacteria bacterium]
MRDFLGKFSVIVGILSVMLAWVFYVNQKQDSERMKKDIKDEIRKEATSVSDNVRESASAVRLSIQDVLGQLRDAITVSKAHAAEGNGDY